ncbi:MAG: hypothetical protein GXO33_07080 [Epsilonproteobacteria bacterium]|nr:hypothetical protein [Campylobacterota bacterium]
MGRLYVLFAHLLQALLMLMALFILILAHPATLRFLLKEAPLPPEIRYDKVEGSLLYGITVKRFRYADALEAESISIRYNIFKLLSPHPMLQRLVIDRPVIDVSAFPSGATNDASKPTTLPFPVILRHLIINRATVHYDKRTIYATLKARNLQLSRDTRVWVENLKARCRVKEGTLFASGDYRKERLRLSGSFRPAATLMTQLRKRLVDPPALWRWHLDLTPQTAGFEIVQPAPLTLREQNATLRFEKLTGRYFLQYAYADIHTRWRLQKAPLSLRCEQNLTITPDLAFATDASVRLLAPQTPLLQTFSLRLAGNKESLVGDLLAPSARVRLYSVGYDRFSLTAKASLPAQALHAYLPQLPPDGNITLRTDAAAHLHPKLEANASIRIDGLGTDIRADVESREEGTLLIARAAPRQPLSPLWRQVPKHFRNPIHLFFYLTANQKNLNLVQRENLITLFQNQTRLTGWARVGTINLNLQGALRDQTLFLKGQTHIPSVAGLLRTLGEATPDFDAEVTGKLTLKAGKTTHVGFQVSVPWYVLYNSAENNHYGLNSSIRGNVKGRKITVTRYELAFDDHRFLQKHPSTILLPKEGESLIRFEEIRFLDHGKLRGSYDTKKSTLHLNVIGKNIHYNGPEGNVTFHSDIRLFKDPQNLRAEGNVTFQEGLITYTPPRSLVATDDDIVIIQHIKEPDHTRSLFDIHLLAANPLRYRLEMDDISANILLKPDLTLWKEPGKPFELLGMVTFPKGTLRASDKTFLMHPSHLYFGGGWPVNPYLDIHLLYPYDDMKFFIYVSHTLHDPVILFSSEPPMSQNDIMSYILFGSPADEAFKDNGGNAMGTMLLGLGVKKALGSTLGITFDTLNIIDNKNGNLGIEVGKRVAKNLKILYRNDSISSFILQYTLSPALRFDVDIKETGEEGINILYIKDFRGPERLNYPLDTSYPNTEDSSAARVAQ